MKKMQVSKVAAWAEIYIIVLNYDGSNIADELEIIIYAIRALASSQDSQVERLSP